jgi:hypothetical protein
VQPEVVVALRQALKLTQDGSSSLHISLHNTPRTTTQDGAQPDVIHQLTLLDCQHSRPTADHKTALH